MRSCYEAYLSAESNSARAEAWFPRAHAHTCRASDPKETTYQGAETAQRVDLLEVDCGVTSRCGNQGFPQERRLLRSREFARVSQLGERAVSSNFVVLVAVLAEAGSDGIGRLGIRVTRRVGNAVARNELKRRIREWFRTLERGSTAGFDLVVIVRRPARKLKFSEFNQELTRLTREGTRRVRDGGGASASPRSG